MADSIRRTCRDDISGQQGHQFTQIFDLFRYGKIQMKGPFMAKSPIFFKQPNIDGLVKSHFSPFSVIPAEAGIQ